MFSGDQRTGDDQPVGCHGVSRSTSGVIAGLRVLHRSVCPRKHERLVPIVVTHEIGRCPIPPSNLDDLGHLIGPAHNSTVHMQPVTY
jgi:hypothetical protein